MKNARFILCFLFLFVAQYCAAQRLPFFNLTVEHGLVQSQATCLTQDKSGNLWIGTLGGISCYDGKKTINYTVSDGLISNTIIDLQYSSDGKLYISTALGLQVFDGKHFSGVRTQDNKEATGVSQIISGPDQKVFCLKSGALFQLDATQRKLQPCFEKEAITTALYDQGNILLAGHNGSVYSFKDSSKTSVIAQSTDPELVILKIFKDSKKRSWFLCNKGLYFQNHDRVEPYLLKGRQAIEFPLLSVAEDKNGQLWFASLSGVFRLNDTAINHFGQKNGLTNNIVYETISDKEGNIWFSSDGEGLFRYSGGPFISLDENFGLPNKQVTGIAGDEEGNIYFSSYSGMLSEYIAGTGIKSIDAPLLKEDAISGILWQQGRGLWIGTRNSGLFLMQNKRIIKFDVGKNNEAATHITALYEDEQKRLFVGLKQNMLCITQKQTDLITIDNIKPLCFTSIGNDSLLIGTENGFWLYSRSISTHWNKGTVTDSIVPQCMVYNKGTLFIGTTEKGIIAYHLADKTYKTINTKNGLSSDFVYNLLKDTAGNIWVGTGRGICTLKEEEKLQFKIHLFGKGNGIIGLESNSNASFADQDGRLWFGTTEGVSCYLPAAKPTVPQALSIVLESVKFFGGKSIDSNFYTQTAGWYDIPENLKLPYRFNNLSFAFQAITLSPADKIYYRYMLEGSGTNWSEWSTETTINFSGLEPGNYTLKVMCKINDVEQKNILLNYAFTIKTPFHKSIWFVISIFGLAILSGVYLQYAANKRKQKRLQREDALRREEQSRVRERTAEDFHDEVGNKLTRINVLTSVLKSKLGAPNSDAERIIQQIQDNSQQLYSGTRDILWSLQPSNDNLFEIINHVRDLAAELFSETDISFSLSGNEEQFREYKMPLDKSRNFIMIWKEALNNCMKYADAKNVLLQIQQTEKGIQIRLVDDGKGFDISTIQQGNGLKNMKSRAARLEATIEVLSKEGIGTQVILYLPDFK